MLQHLHCLTIWMELKEERREWITQKLQKLTCNDLRTLVFLSVLLLLCCVGFYHKCVAVKIINMNIIPYAEALFLSSVYRIPVNFEKMLYCGHLCPSVLLYPFKKWWRVLYYHFQSCLVIFSNISNFLVLFSNVSHFYSLSVNFNQFLIIFSSFKYFRFF